MRDRWWWRDGAFSVVMPVPRQLQALGSGKALERAEPSTYDGFPFRSVRVRARHRRRPGPVRVATRRWRFLQPTRFHLLIQKFGSLTTLGSRAARVLAAGNTSPAEKGNAWGYRCDGYRQISVDIGDRFQLGRLAIRSSHVHDCEATNQPPTTGWWHGMGTFRRGAIIGL